MYLMKFVVLIQIWIQIDAESTLELVHVIFRHGERTPNKKEIYIKSPYYNESIFSPYGHGQLTNEGKRTIYNLGSDLRARYNNFLNTSYHYTLVEGTSSDYERTKESLQLCLAGLFPPTEELMWLPGMNWTPIATYYTNKENDKLFNSLETERYKQELEKFRQTEEGKALEAPFKDLIEYFIQHTEEPIDFEKLGYFTRGVELLDELGLEIPDWIKPYYPEPLTQTIPENFAGWFGSTELRRLFGGPLLKKIIDDTEMKINRTLDPLGRKIFLYAGHDYTITSILTVLDTWDRKIPPVGSYCIFEVHYINRTYGFKIFYFNRNSSEPQLVLLPGFGDFIPINDFKIDRRNYLDAPSSSVGVTGSILTVLVLYSIIFQLG